MKIHKLLLPLLLVSSYALSSDGAYDLTDLHIKFQINIQNRDEICIFGPDLYAGPKKVVCSKCGQPPVMIAIIKGKLESLCLHHAPKRSGKGMDIFRMDPRELDRLTRKLA